MLGALICAGALCYVLFYGIILCVIDCDVQLAFNEKFGKSIGALKGKVVFITGASSGIGKHTALALAKHGVRLVLAARRHALLEQVKTECLAASKGALTSNDVLVLPMDMLDISSHKRHFETALAHFGQIDILLNNAGRSQRAIWESIDLEVDKQMFDINVFSVVNLTRIAVNYFNTKGEGHVALTSSGIALTTIPFSPSYAAAKCAINSYFNTLRLEKLGSETNLTVTILAPGPTYTEFLEHCFTGKPGETYGTSAKLTDKRMTSERCGHLCAVALANKSREAWICIFPGLLYYYASVYYPSLTYFVTKAIGVQRLHKFRDSEEAAFTEKKCK